MRPNQADPSGWSSGQIFVYSNLGHTLTQAAIGNIMVKLNRLNSNRSSFGRDGLYRFREGEMARVSRLLFDVYLSSAGRTGEPVGDSGTSLPACQSVSLPA